MGDEVCKGKPANQSRQEKCHWGGFLGHPGLSQKCSRALLGCSWAAAGCSWSPLLSPWLSCCSPGLSCYSFALLQGAIFVIKSFIRFESILGLGGTSKQHFWGQGIKMLWNRSTKRSEAPTKHQRSMIRPTTAPMVAPTRLPGSKPSNQKTLHLEDGRE